MKLSGHTADQGNGSSNVQLGELILEASAVELRGIAAFLQKAADNMDRMGNVYDHEHLSDNQPGFDDQPHIVVVRPPG